MSVAEADVEDLTMARYQELAGKTANKGIEDKRRVVAALGLAGETGEFVDLIKKVVAHGYDVSDDSLKDELGDVLWYIAETCTAFGWRLEDVAGRNVAKLQRRYPEGFYNRQGEEG